LKPKILFAGFGDLPELGNVIAYETTDYGWRGLTQDGEVLEVKGQNGHNIAVPEGDIIIQCNGKAIGRRTIMNPPVQLDIEEYLVQFNKAVAAYKGNNLVDALAASHASVTIAPTLRAKFNRAMILLASGQWQDGFEEYEECEKYQPFMRLQVKEALDAGLPLWRGEDLKGKTILLLHAHGFGDTLMCLRYVPMLQAMGAQVTVAVEPELEQLVLQNGMQIALTHNAADYFCPFLHLLGRLRITPAKDMNGAYLTVPQTLVDKWRKCIRGERKRIGIAWSVGKPSTGDYPREIPLETLIDKLDQGAELFSVQTQKPIDWFPVNTFEFEDFADCAALMLCMDEIITVDTAAVHLAGAIGHPNVKLLLSHWASWRWRKQWYRNVKICRQTSDGDWPSALQQC
jgi:hypothetical protein